MFGEVNLLVVVVIFHGSQVQPFKKSFELLPWCLLLVTCCTGCKVEWHESSSHVWGGGNLHLACLKCSVRCWWWPLVVSHEYGADPD